MLPLPSLSFREVGALFPHCLCISSLVAQMVKCLPTMLEIQVQSLSWEDLLEKEMTTHSKILAGKSHGWRSLVGYSPWGHKESDMTELLHFHFSACPFLFFSFKGISPINLAHVRKNRKFEMGWVPASSSEESPHCHLEVLL